MSVLTFASAGHSPGVTALSLALTLAWPEPVLLVDANREPDQSVLAGYLQGVDPSGRGLGALLQAHRERRSMASGLAEALIELDAGRDFLPGFSHPGMVSLFAPIWADFCSALSADGRMVLVDAGRIGPAGLPAPLVHGSDAVAVVVGSRLVDLAALRLYLSLVIEAAGEDAVGLIVVGPGRPYGTGEISAQFGVPVWGKVGWLPAAAEVHASGAPAHERAIRPYLVDIERLVQGLAGQLPSSVTSMSMAAPR